MRVMHLSIYRCMRLDRCVRKVFESDREKAKKNKRKNKIEGEKEKGRTSTSPS